MITIDKLKKNFGEKIAVDIEHYEINQGDMLGLVGNNGAGKTTIFNLLTGVKQRGGEDDSLPGNAGSAESGQWESSYK